MSYRTTVVLRQWPDGDVIALMPDEVDRGYVMSYEHIGQHGDADYAGVVSRTKPAYIGSPEAMALVAELRAIGYTPVIRQRRPRR